MTDRILKTSCSMSALSQRLQEEEGGCILVSPLFDSAATVLGLRCSLPKRALEGVCTVQQQTNYIVTVAPIVCREVGKLQCRNIRV